MELLSYNLPLDWNLFLFGDDHEGAALRHDDGWKQLVDMMHSEYGGLPASRNYGVDHGDVIEAIQTDDYRYDHHETKEALTLDQIYQAIKNRDPIKKKILCVIDGNHPAKLHRFGKITAHICKELRVPFGTWSAKLTYNDNKGKLQFKHYATHGFGSITSTADDPQRQRTNMKLALKRKLKKKFGDTLLNTMGHTHKLLVCSPSEELFIVDKENELRQYYTGAPVRKHGFIPYDYRWYCNTGSFLKLYGESISGYAERAGYDPIELGFLVAKIRGGTITEIVKEIV